MTAIENAINNEIVQTGDEATMGYGPGADVEFVREGGVWKIKDLD